MDKLSIKIKILDREYPMKINPSEEERLRRAGKLLNENIRFYRNKFGIDDKQDILSMVAFDALISKLKAESGLNNLERLVNENLEELDHRIDGSED